MAHRFAVKIALRAVTAYHRQKLVLGNGFYALSNRLHVKIVCKVDYAFNDLLFFGILGNIANRTYA